MKVRRGALWLSLIACAGLAAAGYDGTVDRDVRAIPDGNGVEPLSTPVPVASGRSRPGSALDLHRLQSVRARPPATELFVVKSWYIPPPPSPPPSPPPPPPPPPPPAPPPLPFVFMGRMSDAERLTVFLVKDGVVHMVSEGDVIEGTYKLEKIEPRQLTFLYLPLDAKQALAVRDTP